MILFLDIDGVLNIYEGSNPTYMNSSSHFEQNLILLMNGLLDNYKDIEIVVSSSWRSDMDDLKYLLKKDHFKHIDRIMGNTDLNEKNRGEQILDYVNLHNIKKYCVLDDIMEYLDISLNGVIPSEYCVKTDPRNGLSVFNIQEIIKIYKS